MESLGAWSSSCSPVAARHVRTCALHSRSWMTRLQPQPALHLQQQVLPRAPAQRNCQSARLHHSACKRPRAETRRGQRTHCRRPVLRTSLPPHPLVVPAPRYAFTACLQEDSNRLQGFEWPLGLGLGFRFSNTPSSRACRCATCRQHHLSMSLLRRRRMAAAV